jgi:phosphatidylserine/phosphatidylglycerophosphate/cardiolipin synthase-like enzyme
VKKTFGNHMLQITMHIVKTILGIKSNYSARHHRQEKLVDRMVKFTEARRRGFDYQNLNPHPKN